MHSLRRRFLVRSGALLAAGLASHASAAPAGPASMPHIILLGDSILDNASYTGGKPAVIDQVRARLPAGWKASLLAVDGATTAGIPSQLARLPADASHLLLSVGGNDVLGRQGILDAPVRSSADTFSMLAKAVQEFEAAYRKVLDACLRPGLPLTVCTIYNGRFPDPAHQQRVTVALATFNDAIVRSAVERQLQVLELRHICNRPEDFANPIEPSSIGGDKIARAIIRAAAPGCLRQRPGLGLVTTELERDTVALHLQLTLPRAFHDAFGDGLLRKRMLARKRFHQLGHAHVAIGQAGIEHVVADRVPGSHVGLFLDFLAHRLSSAPLND